MAGREEAIIEYLLSLPRDELIEAVAGMTDDDVAALPDQVVRVLAEERHRQEHQWKDQSSTDWWLEPADPIEFATGSDYCNFPAATIRSQLTDMDAIFYRKTDPQFSATPLGVRTNIVLLDGSLGWGKSFETGLIFAYVSHRLLCLRVPQAAWGLSAQSKLALIQISLTEQHAKDIVLEEVRGKIERCAWFKRYKFFKDGDGAGGRLNFPKHISIFPVASKNRSPGGYTIPVAAMDEASWHQEKAVNRSNVIETESGSEADMIFQRLHKSMRSRFLNHWLLIVASSARYEGDFMSRTHEVYGKRHYCYYVARASWEGRLAAFIKPDWATDPEASFIDPVAGRVPIEFKEDFEDDPEDARLHIAGKRGAAGRQFDTEWTVLERLCVDSVKKAPLDEYSQWASEYRYTGGGELWIHFDQASKGDRMGVAGVVLEDMGQDEAGRDRPLFDVVFYSVETGTPNYPLDLDEMREKYLYRPIREWRWPVAGVSTDRHQFESAEVDLRRNGFSCKLISVDSTMEPYRVFRRALHDGRVKGLYDWRPLLRINRQFQRVHLLVDEWRQLIIVPGAKGDVVDHPQTGSKDCTDAVVGAAYGALTSRGHGVRSVGRAPVDDTPTTPEEVFQQARAQRYHRSRRLR